MENEIKWHKAKKAISSKSPLKDILVLHEYPTRKRVTLEYDVEPGKYYITLDELMQLSKEK